MFRPYQKDNYYHNDMVNMAHKQDKQGVMCWPTTLGVDSLSTDYPQDMGRWLVDNHHIWYFPLLLATSVLVGR